MAGTRGAGKMRQEGRRQVGYSARDALVVVHHDQEIRDYERVMQRTLAKSTVSCLFAMAPRARAHTHTHTHTHVNQ